MKGSFMVRDQNILNRLSQSLSVSHRNFMICSEYEGGHAIQGDGCQLAPRESQVKAPSNGPSIILKYFNVSLT
jgi:hypothetical protein